jgi:hypothetical protein|tara:strand:+ start:35 stop:625 length:591 start_codon:yes stop_codon:yes gene_type:complete
MLVNKNAKQSRKVQKNLEKTKKETVTRPNQLIAIKAFEHWVDNLDSSTQESFCSFVSDNNSVIETYLYCRFLGYEGSVASCDSWIKDNYKKPDHRKKLLYEIDEMQEDIRKLREDIETGNVRRDAGVGRIAQMQKELRSTISEIESFTNMRDRKGLLMAGADRAIRELMFIFKDDPIETPLEEATMSVWARMQLEE